MTSTSQCDACVHLNREVSYNPMRCDAFPDGIPIPIQANKHDHSKPYPGDHGIRYEQIRPGPRPEVAVWAILTGWRHSDPRPDHPPTPAELHRPKSRRRVPR
jgi:hypothetical protein